MTPSDFCVQAGKDVTAADAASAPQTPEANTRPLERLFTHQKTQSVTFV